MLRLTWPGPPLWWFRDTLSARYYRQPQWHQIKITPDTIITSHSGSTFQNSSDPGCQPRTRTTEDRHRRMLDSTLWLSSHCVLCEYFRADNGPEIGMKPPFLTAIWRRICDNSMKQRDWGTHVAIGQGETQRPDRFGEGGTNNISRQNNLTYATTVQWVWVPTIVLKTKLIFGSDRSSRSHNLWAFVWFKFV